MTSSDIKSTSFQDEMDRALEALKESEGETTIGRIIEHAEAARRLDPAAAEPLFVLGLAAFGLNDLGAAIQMMEEAHKLNPDGREIAEALAAFHGRVGDLANSLYYTKLAMTLDENPQLVRVIPDFLRDFEGNIDKARQSAYLTDASIEFFLRRFDKAAEFCRRELELHPQNVEAHQLMGRALMELGRYEDAVQALEKSARLAPRDAMGFVHLAEGLRKQGRLDTALECCHEAVRLDPTSAPGRGQLLTTLAYLPSENWRTYAEEAISAINAIAPGPRPAPPTPALEPKTVSKDRHGKIRIGFLVNETAMLRDISFFEAVLAHRDPRRFYIHVYQQYSRPFSDTPRLQGEADDWLPVYNIDDETLSFIASNDALDVLIDMCGAGADGRPTFLAARPAPVQVSWLGFPQGSLPETADWLLADPATAAFDGRDSAGIPIRVLDGGLMAYTGASVAVEGDGENILPASENGFITFGGILDPARVVGSAAAWARVLREVPDSRLLLGRAPSPDKITLRRIQEMFVKNGIVDRVVFQEALQGKSMVAAFYSSVDILLDSQPVNGTTETCEALWRGLPVVSFRGDRRAGAIGETILSAAGRAEWAARDEDGFVAVARKLAADHPGLVALRKSLPDEFKKSRLCDAKGFAAAFGAVLEDLVTQARAKAAGPRLN